MFFPCPRLPPPAWGRARARSPPAAAHREQIAANLFLKSPLRLSISPQQLCEIMRLYDALTVPAARPSSPPPPPSPPSPRAKSYFQATQPSTQLARTIVVHSPSTRPPGRRPTSRRSPSPHSGSLRPAPRARPIPPARCAPGLRSSTLQQIRSRLPLPAKSPAAIARQLAERSASSAPPASPPTLPNAGPSSARRTE